MAGSGNGFWHLFLATPQGGKSAASTEVQGIALGSLSVCVFFLSCGFGVFFPPPLPCVKLAHHTSECVLQRAPISDSRRPSCRRYSRYSRYFRYSCLECVWVLSFGALFLLSHQSIIIGRSSSWGFVELDAETLDGHINAWHLLMPKPTSFAQSTSQPATAVRPFIPKFLRIVCIAHSPYPHTHTCVQFPRNWTMGIDIPSAWIMLIIQVPTQGYY